MAKKVPAKKSSSKGKKIVAGYVIGQAYLIRLATYSWIGRVVAVGEHEVVITNASWVAHCGRYHETLKNGLDGQTITEVEPVASPDDLVLVGRGALIDAAPYNHPLPTKQK